MDRVRFGRALGYGARHAAKTLMQAADAATTSAPAGTASKAASAAQVQAGRTQAKVQAAPLAARVVETGRTAVAATKHAGKLGRSIWTPVARFSSVIWLQVTGLFFALLALFMFQGVWKDRAAMHLAVTSHEGTKFWAMTAAFAVFAYFTVSNFVRAYLKERR